MGQRGNLRKGYEESLDVDPDVSSTCRPGVGTSATWCQRYRGPERKDCTNTLSCPYSSLLNLSSPPSCTSLFLPSTPIPLSCQYSPLLPIPLPRAPISCLYSNLHPLLPFLPPSVSASLRLKQDSRTRSGTQCLGKDRKTKYPRNQFTICTLHTRHPPFLVPDRSPAVTTKQVDNRPSLW